MAIEIPESVKDWLTSLVTLSEPLEPEPIEATGTNEMLAEDTIAVEIVTEGTTPEPESMIVANANELIDDAADMRFAAIERKINEFEIQLNNFAAVLRNIEGTFTIINDVTTAAVPIGDISPAPAFGDMLRQL